MLWQTLIIKYYALAKFFYCELFLRYTVCYRNVGKALGCVPISSMNLSKQINTTLSLRVWFFRYRMLRGFWLTKKIVFWNLDKIRLPNKSTAQIRSYFYCKLTQCTVFEISTINAFAKELRTTNLIIYHKYLENGVSYWLTIRIPFYVFWAVFYWVILFCTNF